MYELKPCPFCGGKAFLLLGGDDDEINAILERELLKAADIIKVDCSRYIDEDREQFIKILKKGGDVEL